MLSPEMSQLTGLRGLSWSQNLPRHRVVHRARSVSKGKTNNLACAAGSVTRRALRS